MRNIGWGDLLIDLSGLGLAQNNGSLFGVHFGRNSGGMTELGLYKDVTAKAIGGQHQGYGSIAQYDGFVKNQKSAGKLSDETRLYGDVSRSEGASYYGQPYNVIGSGEFVSSIEMLDLSELMKRGYKGDQFQGKSTIAFKISKQGFAPAPVPEPSSVLGLLGLGLIVARRRQA